MTLDNLTVKIRARIWPPGLMWMLRAIHGVRPVIGAERTRRASAWLLNRSHVSLSANGGRWIPYAISAAEPSRRVRRKPRPGEFKPLSPEQREHIRRAYGPRQRDDK